MSKTIFPSGVPRGTSTSPVLFIFPTRLKVFVPLLFSVPTPANQSAPLKIIWGISDHVSTLLMVVGLPKSPPPTFAGKGGLWRGLPLFPSIEIKRPVSSPQTKAPAPGKMSIENSKLVPMVFLPRSPYSRAWAMAWLKVSIARGYSART
ncbi:hypothetical protein ES703_71252 [subsurface metagenome]